MRNETTATTGSSDAPTRLPIVVNLLVALAFSLSCATTPTLHRGAPPLAIMSEVERVVVEDGYTCAASPARDVLHCGHPKLYDLSFAYLPASNYLHIYSSFDRLTDEGFADLWRGSCEQTLPEVNNVNATFISKVTCEDNFIFFVFYAWIPDNGLTDDDLRGLTGVARAAITDAIHAGHMLKPDGNESEHMPLGVPDVGAPPVDDKAREPGHVESL